MTTEQTFPEQDSASDGQTTQGVLKSPDAFRTISEVSKELNIPSHVLRFWETRFHQIKPMKRGGGRRYYRPQDVRLIQRIQSLLHIEGYTIKGVQQLLKKSGVRSAAQVVNIPQPSDPPSSPTVSSALPTPGDRHTGNNAVAQIDVKSVMSDDALSKVDQTGVVGILGDLQAIQNILAAHRRHT